MNEICRRGFRNYFCNDQVALIILAGTLKKKLRQHQKQNLTLKFQEVNSYVLTFLNSLLPLRNFTKNFNNLIKEQINDKCGLNLIKVISSLTNDIKSILTFVLIKIGFHDDSLMFSRSVSAEKQIVDGC